MSPFAGTGQAQAWAEAKPTVVGNQTPVISIHKNQAATNAHAEDSASDSRIYVEALIAASGDQTFSYYEFSTTHVETTGYGSGSANSYADIGFENP